MRAYPNLQPAYNASLFAQYPPDVEASSHEFSIRVLMLRTQRVFEASSHEFQHRFLFTKLGLLVPHARVAMSYGGKAMWGQIR